MEPKKHKFQFGKPCMGLFLQGGVKALSVVEAGVEISLLVVGTVAILFLFPYQDFDNERKTGSWKFYARVGSYAYSYLYAFSNIFLSQKLYSVASQRDLEGFSFYLNISGALYGLCSINFILYTWRVGWLQPVTMSVFLGFMIYKLYFFWVIVSFFHELQQSTAINSAVRGLSDEEMQDFFSGSPSVNLEVDNYDRKPYNWDFEIPFEKLVFDENMQNVLGQGEFGIVHRAKLNDCPVAVKTVSAAADVMYFKALLSELKILTYIGSHEHIVNLIGACSSQLKDRKLFIIFEFCYYGSISDYLKKHREQYQEQLLIERLNQQHPSKTSFYVGESSGKEMWSRDELLKWSIETSSGMEYISIKRVIHGDLAARNVLLTRNKVAKIADFGLSRHTFKYNVYKKKNNEPLPWPWMAPEALSDLLFSTKSDVYSFGITLYEYFSGGLVPYGGRVYSDEFLSLLKAGKIYLEQPTFASDEVYKILQKCCNLIPESRPSFGELKLQLEKLYIERRQGLEFEV